MTRNDKRVVQTPAGLGIAVVALAVWTWGLPVPRHPRPNGHIRATEPAAPVLAALDGNREQARNVYAKLPVAFIENRGQTDSRVRYYAQGSRYAFYLTRDQVVLSFAKQPSTQGLTLGLRFLGSNPKVVVEGEARAAGAVNYFHGNDPAGWQTEVPRYGQIVYRELWPGVDLRLREQAGTLKYEFRVRPGARPALRASMTGGN